MVYVQFSAQSFKVWGTKGAMLIMLPISPQHFIPLAFLRCLPRRLSPADNYPPYHNALGGVSPFRQFRRDDQCYIEALTVIVGVIGVLCGNSFDLFFWVHLRFCYCFSSCFVLLRPLPSFPLIFLFRRPGRKKRY